MKSANLLSSTDPFVQKIQAALYTSIYYHCCALEAVGFIWSVLCWWNVVKCL